MHAAIRHFKDEAGYFFEDEACHINELSNSGEDPEVSIAQVRVEPGQATNWHRLHGITERYVLLSGTGLVEVANLAPTEVGPGTVVLIPPGSPQRITNTGSDTLVFLAVCSPRFMMAAYQTITQGE